MKITEAIEIVERGQRWRRGEEIEMVEPKLFGEAIDMVLNALLNKNNEILHKLGIDILKRQFEVYTPLRKYVVEVPEIVMEFDRIGIDIVPPIDF